MRRLLVTLALGGLVLAPGHAVADPEFTLEDGNSSFSVDAGDQIGMFDWTVDDVDHVFQQWFWFRVGGTGGEASIESLPLLVSGTTDTDFDGTDETLFLKYGDLDEFTISITMSLTGGQAGSNTADISEDIAIDNFSGAPLVFHFFQYVDFDLCETIGDDTVTVVNPNNVTQTDPVCAFTEVTGSSHSHVQVGPFASILDLLNDGDPTTLDDSTFFGPGDATWARQWDFTLASGGSFVISKDKLLGPVPEPGTVGLLGLGLLALGLRALRR